MVYGVGAGFLSVDWLIACSDSENGSTTDINIDLHTSLITINIGFLTTSSCVTVNRVYQIERAVCFIISVCLCHGSVYCASLSDEPEVCQHARASFRCSSRCPVKAQMLCHCARWQQFQFHKTVLMVQIFACYDEIDWFTLSCDGPIGCVCHHFIC